MVPIKERVVGKIVPERIGVWTWQLGTPEYAGMQDCYDFFEWDVRAIEVIKSESTENWISINFPQINPVKNGEW